MTNKDSFDLYNVSYQEKVSTLVQKNDIDTAMSLAVGGGYDVIGKLEFLLLKQFGLKSTNSLIDVGCGSGRLASKLQDYLTGEYIGTDILESLLEFAKGKCHQNNFQFLLSHNTSLPRENCSTDFVCFFSIFTHLSHIDSYKYLNEATRVLREGGRIVFSFLEFKIGEHWNVFENSLNNRESTSVHDQFLSRDAIEAWAKHIGLKIISIEDGNKYSIIIPNNIEISDPDLISGKLGRLGQSICVLEKPITDHDYCSATKSESLISIDFSIKNSMHGKSGKIFVGAVDRETENLYSITNKEFKKITLQNLQPITHVIYGNHSIHIDIENINEVDCNNLDIYIGYGDNSEEMVRNKSFFFALTLTITHHPDIKSTLNYQELLDYATHKNFLPEEYLTANPDVERSIENGTLASAYDHFITHGIAEQRFIRRKINQSLKYRKIKKINAIINHSLDFSFHDGFYDFITQGQSKPKINNLEAISENSYDDNTLNLINEFKNGLVLDCGAGRRSVYYENVVNMDISPYDAIDVIAYAEDMPFLDATFDAVICLAVLEHVKNPFKCAQELIRILKPGGKILCAVPFLQPFHAYPNHYYNMTSHGLINLFQDQIDVEKIDVYGGFLPIGSLTWILNSWSDGLSEKTRDDFMKMQVRDLISPVEKYLGMPFVMELNKEKNLELASATAMFGKKKAL